MPEPRRRQRPLPNLRDTLSNNHSLLHLDPEPIGSPTAETPVAFAFSDASNERSASDKAATNIGSAYPPGLSGSGRGAIYYLTRMQKYSSYAMSIFTTLHLGNVSLIPATTGSVDASETFLLMTREIYQTSVSEPLLILLPFIVHIGSGIVLRLVRRARNVKRYGYSGNESGVWPTFSWISVTGYAFTALYSVHSLINRVLPLAVEGDSSNIGLAYVAHGFARYPWTCRFAYMGLIGFGASHMVWGFAKWYGLSTPTRGWLQPRKKKDVLVDKNTMQQRRRQWMGVHGAAIAVAGLWSVGGMGIVARGGASDGWVGQLYDNLYQKVVYFGF